MTDFAPIALWPIRWACDVSTASPIVTGLAARYATDTIWALSGRQYGLITITLRPARWFPRETSFPDAWLAMPGAMLPPLGATSYGGGWWGWPGFCMGSTEAHLPAPVKSITQVKVDGAILPTTSYRVDDNRILVRIDGGTWPSYNDLRFADTAVGTWSVTAQYGQSVPDGAELAVGELACEYLRAINGEDCRLPRNISSIARQGVTITMPDPVQTFKDGLTGLRLVDQFVMTWNPNRLKRRAKAYSVDLIVARRTNT